MKSSFGIDLNDHLEFYKNYFKNSELYKKGKKRSFFIVPISFVFIFLLDFFSTQSFNKEIFINYSIISFIWMSLSYFFYDKLVLKKMIKHLKNGDHSILFGNHDLELNEKNIVISANGTKSEINWDAIIKIEDAKEYMFLYIAEDRAVIIPIYKLSDNKEGIISFIKSKI